MAYVQNSMVLCSISKMVTCNSMLPVLIIIRVWNLTQNQKWNSKESWHLCHGWKLLWTAFCCVVDENKEKLGGELQPLFITVDPSRDDVEAVKEYVKGTFLFLILDCLHVVWESVRLILAVAEGAFYIRSRDPGTGTRILWTWYLPLERRKANLNKTN